MPPLASSVPTTWKEVNDMMERLKEFKHNLETGGSLRLVNGGSPFTIVVLYEVLLVGARLHHLESFDGSTDPDDHLCCFLNTMQLHNFSDAILYKTFTTTLKGVARTWLISCQVQQFPLSSSWLTCSKAISQQASLLRRIPISFPLNKEVISLSRTFLVTLIKLCLKFSKLRQRLMLLL